MADLDEADKRAIHGDNYAALEARELLEKQAPVTPEEKRRALARHVETNNIARFSAMALMFVGVLLIIGAYYRVGTLDTAGQIAAVMIAIGLGWYAWLVQNGKALVKRFA
ncbi:MAG: hypothetical protein JWM36_1577 [Hyphomicrobiales bacterium]|jgi:hypothetical protein|nr:hypothetical protein [Hyphomicrobiales bacterium]